MVTCPSLHERQPLLTTGGAVAVKFGNDLELPQAVARAAKHAQDDVIGAGFIQRGELVVDFLGRADQCAGNVGRTGFGVGEDVRTAGLVRCLRHVDRPLPHRVGALDRVLLVLLVLGDVEFARKTDFHRIVGTANGLQFRLEEFEPLLDDPVRQTGRAGG